MDVTCPLNCQQIIPKNKVEQHVAEECVRRDFTCQHCNFKATYEEVVGTHLGKCLITPQQCPYLCGGSFVPEAMMSHVQICPLRVSECQFSPVGCDKILKLNDQEGHNVRSLQQHVQLTAAATVSGCRHLYNISCELGKRQDDLDKKQQKLVDKLWKQIYQQQQMMQQMKEKLKTLEDQQLKYQQQQEAVLKQAQQIQQRLEGEKEALNKLGLQGQEHYKHLEEKLKKHFDQEHKQKFEEMEAKMKKSIDHQQQKQFCQLDKRLKQHLDQTRHNETEEMEAKMKKYIDHQQQKQFLQLEKRLKQHLDQTRHNETEETEAKMKKYIDHQQQKQFLQLEKSLKHHLDQTQHSETEEKQATSMSPTSTSKKSTTSSNHSFVIDNFKLQIGRGRRPWESPLMYTHHQGYKFLVKIDFSEQFSNDEKAMDVEFILQRGRHNDYLTWPVHVDFSWELCNDRGEKLHNSICSSDWEKYSLGTGRISYFCSQHAVPISKLLPHIYNDRLYFNITSITVI